MYMYLTIQNRNLFSHVKGHYITPQNDTTINCQKTLGVKDVKVFAFSKRYLTLIKKNPSKTGMKFP